MVNGKCDCKHNGIIGLDLEPCSSNSCPLINENDRCFSMLYEGKLTKGCIHKTNCFDRNKINSNKHVISCCADDSCNEKDNGDNMSFVRKRDFENFLRLRLPTPPTTKESDSGKLSTVNIVLMIAVPVALIIILAVIFMFWRNRRRMKQNQFRKVELEKLISGSGDSCDVHNLDLRDLTTSGSGSGLPLLIQRTIARQIELCECVGKGRFGAVHRGVWHQQNVAVKIFATSEEASWFREAQVYQTTMLRHSNVLGFIAADNKDTGACTQLWLVTEYHSNGSLFDYLQDHILTISEMVNMVLSIVNGLSHLHLEVIGTQGKPAMAHRDLKTKNILVKDDRTCCIADLGLTVLHTSINNKVDIPTTTRTGTRRYQAPEILNEAIDLTHFDSYRRADVYALGLCIWEICRRTVVDGQVEEYELPYFDCVPSDPSFDEMKDAVCVREMRPCLSERWHTNEVVNNVTKVMKECWYAEGAARLTVLRLKKNFLTISQRLVVNA